MKTMIQTVSVYVEDPLQEDWDHIAEKMVRAINNSRDSTRKETLFYLAHDWDAQSTLKTMTESIRLPPVNQGKEINSANPVMWRRGQTDNGRLRFNSRTPTKWTQKLDEQKRTTNNSAQPNDERFQEQTDLKPLRRQIDRTKKWIHQTILGSGKEIKCGCLWRR